jgi:hypothetical protein
MIEEWDVVREAARNKTLNAIGWRMGIDKIMKAPPGAKPSVIMVATAVEAVMDAVHKGGVGRRWMQQLRSSELLTRSCLRWRSVY